MSRARPSQGGAAACATSPAHGAPFSGRRCMPCRHGLMGEPYRQTSSRYKRGIVFRPVRHPVSDFRDLMAAALVEFAGHRFRSQERRMTWPVLRSTHQPSVQVFHAALPIAWRVRTHPFHNLRPVHAPTRTDEASTCNTVTGTLRTIGLMPTVGEIDTPVSGDLVMPGLDQARPGHLVAQRHCS